LLVLPVGGGECLRDRFLAKNEIEEIEERLVGVRGRVLVWDVGWGATNAIELGFKGSKTRQGEVILPVIDIGGRIRQAESVLNV
jgi:hypothetical protein